MAKQPLAPENRRLPLDSELLEAVRERRLAVSAIAVLVCLRSHMNARANRFICWPSQTTISRELGFKYKMEKKDGKNVKIYETRQVRRILKSLEAAGLIRIEKRKQGNTYGSNNLNQYSFVRWWVKNDGRPDAGVRTRPDICDQQTGHLRQADRTPLSAPERTPMSLQNNIREKTEGKKKRESSPPTPQRGAEEEEKALKPEKNKQPVTRGKGDDVTPLHTMGKDERISEIRSKMKSLQKDRKFDDMNRNERIEFVDLAVEGKSIENDDPSLPAYLERYAKSIMYDVDMSPNPEHSIRHRPAYKATVKYHALKRDKKDFEEWRSSRQRVVYTDGKTGEEIDY